MSRDSAERDEMRKFMVVPMAGLLLLAAAAPALAGPNVGNASGSTVVAQGSWESFDETTQTYTYGYISVGRDSESPGVQAQYEQHEEQYGQCTGADTPDDPDDDSYGAIVTSVWGYSDDASLTVARNNSAATAGGTLTAARDSYIECTGEGTKDESSPIEFTLGLTATSDTIRESGRGSFHIPGEVNLHSSYKAVYRMAEGTFDGPNGEQAVAGMIGKVSWMDHGNG
jgi:hypothetical protein